MKRKLVIGLLACGAALAQNATKTLTILPGGQIRFYDADASNTVTLTAPALTGNVAWTLPATDVAHPLCSDGAGVLTFTCDADVTFRSLYIKREGATRADMLHGGVGAGGMIRTWNSAGDTVLNTINQDGGDFITLKIGGTEVVSAGRNATVQNLNVLGTCTGCGTGSLPIIDTTAVVKGSVDATKLIRFEVDGLTTATTRVLTPQDSNYTIAGTNIANTFTSNQTLSGVSLLATGTANIGQGATPFNDVFGTILYAPTVAMHESGDAGTSFKWKFDPYAVGANILYLTDPGPTDILYISAAVSPRIMRWKGHFLPMADTNTYDIGAIWPDLEWKDGYFAGDMHALSYSIRTGNATYEEVVDANQHITGNTITSKSVGVKVLGSGGVLRADMIPGGVGAGGIIRTWDSAGTTVLNQIDDDGSLIAKRLEVTGAQGTVVTDSNSTSNYVYIHGNATTAFDVASLSSKLRLYGHTGIDFRTGSVDPIATFSAAGELDLKNSGLKVNGTTVIGFARNVDATSIQVGGVTVVDSLRNITVTSCTGCLSSLSTSITFSSTVYDIADSTNPLNVLYTQSINGYRLGTPNQLRYAISGGGVGGGGTLSLYNSSGSLRSGINDTIGVFSNVGYTANGSAGISATFDPNTCTSLTFTFGILTSKAGC